MPKVHGKDTYVSLDGVDIGIHGTNVEYGRSGDSHDVTTFGSGDSHVFLGGLKNGTASMSGMYDSTAVTGPRAAITPLIGTVVEMIYRPEGTGAGRPQDTVDVLVTAFNETAPVAGYVTFVAELQLSGDVVQSTQA